MNFIKSINLSFKEYKNSFFQYKLTFFTSILLAVFCILDICWNGSNFSHKLIKSAHCGLLISAVASYSEIFLTQRMSCILKKNSIALQFSDFFDYFYFILFFAKKLFHAIPLGHRSFHSLFHGIHFFTE